MVCQVVGDNNKLLGKFPSLLEATGFTSTLDKSKYTKVNIIIDYSIDQVPEVLEGLLKFDESTSNNTNNKGGN